MDILFAKTKVDLQRTINQLQELLEARMRAPISNGKVHPDMRYLCVYDLLIFLQAQLEED